MFAGRAVVFIEVEGRELDMVTMVGLGWLIGVVLRMVRVAGIWTLVKVVVWVGGAAWRLTVATCGTVLS